MTPKPKRRKAARASRPLDLDRDADSDLSAFICDYDISVNVTVKEGLRTQFVDLTPEDVARLAPFFAQADAYFKAKGKR